ncbi:methyltransferase [Actinokineospora terrae]|uniref:O-methyltransferase n=1 Tax=Actinokineospora terrae TaxID=155974 RepID=A0A1H9ML47_9PSEU|nr:methyltransferase [Actinokineospora terrae]SER24422.1 O-methyltransferase [Actinokineospora terrae]
MTAEATLARFREYMVGPARFMNLLSCFELGIVDELRARPGLTAAELGAAVGAKAAAIEQMLFLPVKEGFVAHDETSGGYRLDALADVPEAELAGVVDFMHFIKVVTLRQLFHLTESVRSGTLVGLSEFYGFEGTLYEAAATHKDIGDPWSRVMNATTARIDPWFFANIDVPAGSRVLDLAGNTGLGAIHTYRHKASPGLTVTTFDLPEREEDCLRNFREHGVQEHCSFIGGDVFVSIPGGFDVVLVKHFIDMWDKDDVLRILSGVRDALEPGGQVHILVPIYPEDVHDTDNYTIDFFPSFFLGCSMGYGGPQKLSVYRAWLEESGFTVTQTLAKDPADLPRYALPVQAILSATKPV